MMALVENRRMFELKLVEMGVMTHQESAERHKTGGGSPARHRSHSNDLSRITARNNITIVYDLAHHLSKNDHYLREQPLGAKRWGRVSGWILF